ncbi:MAG: prepilin-type N-terminal cleavage/methylation domain-containing protein [Smithellaceae bacterium]|nr:prepilin-type N-terminal cleavage/methylation domain-containing protein [Smithellaceae bacterium]
MTGYLRSVSPPESTIRTPGFTLMEVMIAMAVLAIALVAAFQLQSQSLSMTDNSRFLTTASLLAQAKMTEFETAPPLNLQSGKGDFGEDYPSFRWQAVVSDTQLASFKKIELTVTDDTRADNAYSLTMYRFTGKS